MKERLEELHESIKRWMKTNPEYARAFMNFLNTVGKPSKLDAKTKELIAVALSVYAQCEWCIAFHVKNALENGASPEEIREASWIAVLLGGGPKLSYMQLVEKALEEYTSEK